MAKKVYEMSEDEKKLYNELKKDVVKANQRIRQLMKLGIEEPFAYKQLHDYLSANTIKAITQSGYISLKKEQNLQQLLGIKRATEDFLSDEGSTYRGIKQLKEEYEGKAGKELDLKYVNTLYQLQGADWIYDYIPKSEFWDEYAPLTRTLDMESWIEQLYYKTAGKDKDLADEDLRNDLEALYIYVKEE